MLRFAWQGGNVEVPGSRALGSGPNCHARGDRIAVSAPAPAKHRKQTTPMEAPSPSVAISPT